MKEGDFIKIEYDAFVKETGQLVDTTHEDVAKEHDLYNERAHYVPVTVIVGAGQVIKGLDQDLLQAETGVPREVEIDQKEAYGERDPKLVEVAPMQKVLSLPEFRKGDRYPSEGMEIQLNNRMGVISRIFAGRVRVDFNNRWAGKTLVYKYSVKESIEDVPGKIMGIIESDFGRSDEFLVTLEGEDQVDVVLPDMVKLDSSWMMTKFRLVSDMRKYLGFKKIRFIEEYVKKDDAEHDHDHDHDEGSGDEASETEAKNEPEISEPPEKEAQN